MLKPNLAQRILQSLTLVVGAVFLGTVLCVTMLRLGYPYELEWMEGGSWQIVQRILAGQAVYVPPTVDYVPFIYSPFYFYLASGFSFLLGDGFAPLRLVSLLAWLGSLGLIFKLVARRTEGRMWAFLGAALYAACFEIGGGWFDLARVDSLYLLFLLLAVFLLDRPFTRWSHIVAGAVFVLAFLTKQSALVVLLPIMLWMMVTIKGSRRWWFPGVATSGVAAAALLLHLFTDGWFSFYVFQLPSAHEIAWPLVVEFWRFDILAPLPFALLAVVGLLLPGQDSSEAQDRRWLLVLALAFLGSSYFSRLHAGGWLNVLLPGYAMLSVILACSLGRAFSAAGKAFQSLILALCLLQFGLLVFDPRDHLPTAADGQAGDQLVAQLAQSEGPVWLPHHGYLAQRAGHAGTAHAMAMEDVLRGGDPDLALALDQQMRRDIQTGRWQLLVLDGLDFDQERAGLYGDPGPAFADTTVFWTKTGLGTRPELIIKREK